MRNKIVTIKWVDHHSNSSWQTIKEIKEWATKPQICITTGTITYEDKNVIVLSASFDGEEEWGDSMCINKKLIVK